MAFDVEPFSRGINILGVWLKVFHPGCLFGTKGFPYGRFHVILCEHTIVPPRLGHVALRGRFKHCYEI